VGTPREVIDKVSAALIDILKRPAVQAQLMTAGYSATGAGPEAFARIIADEVPKWKEVIVQAGLKPQ